MQRVGMLNVEVGAVRESEPRMLLKTIVAATSPWVRIPRLPLDLGKPVLTWAYPREAHVLGSSLTAVVNCLEWAGCRYWNLRVRRLAGYFPAQVGARVGRSPWPSSQPPIRGQRPRLLRKLRVSVVADAARMQSHSGLVE
jgi:hypothetical protein